MLFAAGEKSPFAQLVPKFAAGLRANGMSRVETSVVPGAVHYLAQDQPDEVARLIEQHAAR